MSDRADRLAARIAPYLELCYPREHAEVTRRLVALAETYAARTRAREMQPPTHRTGKWRRPPGACAAAKTSQPRSAAR